VADPTEHDLERLLGYLRDERGADFTGYKRPSLTRLVNRRMRSAGADSYNDYLDLLQVEAGELPKLLDTLLINVTSLLRDPATWTELRDEHLPAALAELAPEEPVRAWSAACATGEEAYTIAMLLHEVLGDDGYRRRVKVYATDVDEPALHVARAGRYPANSLDVLSDEQRATFFEPDGDLMRFRQDLRQNIIFGRHDLVQDAPISRVLLLTCRNVLMYLNAETQAQVLERFPFALHEHGLLVLGKAEMLLTQSALFAPVSLPHRIFRTRRLAPASRIAALAVGASGRNLNLRRATEAAFVATPAAQVVLDEDAVLTLINDRAVRDLRLEQADLGRPFAELQLSYRPVELRGLVAAVQASGETSGLRDVEWSRDDRTTWWNVDVGPLGEDGDVLGVHLVFTDVTEQHELRARLEAAHRDLSVAYEELQSSSEELETTNEELQSAVEELETTNEELQSTNEELETMNEELQSTNEELQTLNDELRERTLQVDEANAFLQSIVEGLDRAVVVVGADYRVLLWNTGAERLTGLRNFEAEGLLVFDIALELPLDELHSALRRVVLEGAEQEHLVAHVTNRFGKQLRRELTASALRGRGDLRGAVITLTDHALDAAVADD
jgi:two-component system, chemotaxis family, CheB/CheR fusion protein